MLFSLRLGKAKTALRSAIIGSIVAHAKFVKIIIILTPLGEALSPRGQAIFDAASGDTIVFNLTVPDSIVLVSTLGISQNLIIMGPGADSLSVSGGGAVRVFSIADGSLTVEINGITISNGNSDQAGGGVFN